MSERGAVDWSRVERAADDYYQAVGRGEPISAEQFASRYPDLREQLLATLRLGAAMEGAIAGPAIGPGTRVGGLRIERLLGQGSFGEVYEAYEDPPGRRVAVKTLRPLHQASAQVRARFAREALAVGRLSHPNLVPLFRTGEHQGSPYLVMELVDGRPLADVVQEPPRPATRDLLRMLADCCDAAHAAHDAGVIHRDLKPANLILDRQGRLRILDFGLARIEGDASLSQSHAVIGSFGYMSPEQARGQRATSRSDVYGLGACACFCATGLPPAEGLALVREAALRAVLLRALDEVPERRYVTARELGEELRAWCAGRRVRARRRVRLALAAFGIVAAAAVGLGLERTFAAARRGFLRVELAAGTRLALRDPAGDEVALAAAGQWLPPGTYRARATRTGHLPVERMIELSPGSRAEVRLATLDRVLWHNTREELLGFSHTQAFGDADGDGLTDFVQCDARTIRVVSGLTGSPLAGGDLPLTRTAFLDEADDLLVCGLDAREALVMLRRPESGGTRLLTAVQLLRFEPRQGWQELRRWDLEDRGVRRCLQLLPLRAHPQRWVLPCDQEALVADGAEGWLRVVRAPNVVATCVVPRTPRGGEAPVLVTVDGQLTWFGTHGEVARTERLTHEPCISAVAVDVEGSGADAVVVRVRTPGLVWRLADGTHGSQPLAPEWNLAGCADLGDSAAVVVSSAEGNLAMRWDPRLRRFGEPKPLPPARSGELAFTANLGGAGVIQWARAEGALVGGSRLADPSWRLVGPDMAREAQNWSVCAVDVTGDGALDVLVVAERTGCLLMGVPGPKFAAFDTGQSMSYVGPTLVPRGPREAPLVVFGARPQGPWRTTMLGRLWALTSDTLLPVWDRETSSEFANTVALASVDAQPRLVVAAPSHALSCLLPESGAPVWTADPGQAPSTRTQAVGNACVFATADHGPVAVVTDMTGCVSAWRVADGALRWHQDLFPQTPKNWHTARATPFWHATPGNRSAAGVVVAAIRAPEDRAGLYCLDAAIGALLHGPWFPRELAPAERTLTATPIPCGPEQMVIATERGRILIVGAHPDHQVVREWLLPGAPPIHGTPTRVEAGHGRGDLWIGDAGRMLWAVAQDAPSGELPTVARWQFELDGECAGRPAAADVDGDGWQDAVVCTRGGTLFVVDGHHGRCFMRYRVGASECSGSVAITTGSDGIYGIVACRDGWLHHVRLQVSKRRVAGMETHAFRQRGWLSEADW